MNEKVKLTDEQIAARNPSYSFQDLLDVEEVRERESLPESLNFPRGPRFKVDMKATWNPLSPALTHLLGAN